MFYFAKKWKKSMHELDFDLDAAIFHCILCVMHII